MRGGDFLNILDLVKPLNYENECYFDVLDAYDKGYSIDFICSVVKIFRQYTDKYSIRYSVESFILLKRFKRG